jgi:archaemetzincin
MDGSMKAQLLSLLCFIPSLMAEEQKAAIVIQPLGTVKEARIEVVKAALEKAYSTKVEVLPSKALPKDAWYQPRSRYRADKLLDFLHGVEGHKSVIGITEKDISTTKGEHEDWGIFGLGELGGTTCVVSAFRLKARGADEKKLRERLGKIAVHEIGHVAGLDHCPAKGCVMQDAESSIDTVDRESGEFCESCKPVAKQWIETSPR